MAARTDLGLGFELTTYQAPDGVLAGYFVTGPAAPACRSPHSGRCGGLCLVREPSVQCSCGGQHGFVRDGRYVNAGGVTA